MNLKDFSNVVKDSIQECIDSHVNLDDVDIYIGDCTYAYKVNKAQLRFSSVVKKHGILVLEYDQ